MPSYDPPASFMGLPTEIRSMVLEYVLPKDTIRCHLVNGYTSNGQSTGLFIRSQGWAPWYFNALRINQQCHAEASRLLYRAKVICKINQDSFSYGFNCSEVRMMAKAMEEKKIYRWDFNHPGPRLCLFTEVRLVFEPTNAPGLWYCIYASMKPFCQQCMGLEQPLKRLTIQMEDMIRHEFDPSISVWRYPFWSVRRYFPITARFEDYRFTLECLKEVAFTARKCDVYLPYWMEMHYEKDHLIEKWAGAHLSFSPFPRTADFSGRARISGVVIREWLQSLPEGELQREDFGFLARLD